MVRNLNRPSVSIILKKNGVIYRFKHNELGIDTTILWWSYSPCVLFMTHFRDANHDDVIKWKHFPRYWPFVRGIHRSRVNSPNKGQWRGALMFSLFSVWINGWVNNREAGDLRRYRVHNDVIVMQRSCLCGYSDSRLSDSFIIMWL